MKTRVSIRTKKQGDESDPAATHSVDRRCDVNMDPDTRPIKTQMGTDEEAGAGALGVLTILLVK